MHIFSYFLVFYVSLFGNEKQIKISSLDSTSIKLLLDSLIADNSSYTLEYHLTSFDIDKKTSHYQAVDRGKSIDSLILFSENQFNDQITKQILRPFKNLGMGKQIFLTGERLPVKYYFINSPPRIQYRLFSEKKLAALIFLKPDFHSFLSGTFGLSRINDRIDVIGELNLSIENFTKNAEQLEVLWEKDGETSQKVYLGGSYPHFLGSEVGLSLQYYFENFNAFYTKSEKKIMLNTFLPLLNDTKVGFVSGNFFSTKLGKESGYSDGYYMAFAFNSLLDTRNHRLLPSKGKFFNLNVDGGLEKKSIFLKTQFEIQQYFNLLKAIFAKFQITFHDITYLKGNVPKSRYFQLGGASDLRGFDEGSLIFPRFHIFTFELINQQDRPFQIKTFVDMGSNKIGNIKEYFLGYGFGFKQLNDKTMLSIDYSLSSNKWESGKIHFKWSARL